MTIECNESMYLNVDDKIELQLNNDNNIKASIVYMDNKIIKLLSDELNSSNIRNIICDMYTENIEPYYDTYIEQKYIKRSSKEIIIHKKNNSNILSV